MTAPPGNYQPFWIWPAVLGGIGLIVLVLWALNRISPPSKRTHTAIGDALMPLDTILRPSREHIVEAREWEEAEDDAGGDPPESGKTN